MARAISRDVAEVLVEADGGRAGRIGKCSGCNVVTACYRITFEVVTTIDTVSHRPLQVLKSSLLFKMNCACPLLLVKKLQ